MVVRVLGQASLRARAPVAARLCGGANRYILVPATVYGTATTRCMPTSRRARGAGRHAASVPAQLLARRARALGARAATCGRTCGYVSDTLEHSALPTVAIRTQQPVLVAAVGAVLETVTHQLRRYTRVVAASVTRPERQTMRTDALSAT